MDLSEIQKAVASVLAQANVTDALLTKFPERWLDPHASAAIWETLSLASKPDANGDFADGEKLAAGADYRFRLVIYYPKTVESGLPDRIMERIMRVLRFDRSIRIAEMEQSALCYDKVCRMFQNSLTVTLSGQLVGTKEDEA